VDTDFKDVCGNTIDVGDYVLLPVSGRHGRAPKLRRTQLVEKKIDRRFNGNDKVITILEYSTTKNPHSQRSTRIRRCITRQEAAARLVKFTSTEPTNPALDPTTSADMNNVDEAVEALDKLSREEIGAVAESFIARLGVKLAAPAVPTFPAEQDVEEKTEFDVILTATGITKIEVIRAVREITCLTLKEAKDFVEKTSDRVVKEGVPKADAERVKERLERAGATVWLR
jgi:large subunit ribosomal protein L7/L12